MLWLVTQEIGLHHASHTRKKGYNSVGTQNHLDRCAAAFRRCARQNGSRGICRIGRCERCCRCQPGCDCDESRRLCSNPELKRKCQRGPSAIQPIPTMNDGDYERCASGHVSGVMEPRADTGPGISSTGGSGTGKSADRIMVMGYPKIRLVA